MTTRLLPLLALLACAATTAQADPAPVHFAGHQSQVPAEWVAEPPKSNMRALQYQVPGAEGTEPGQFVVFYFGPGQGGSVEANMERWRSQFSGPDGAPVAPSVTRIQGTAFPSTLVELEGSYARNVGMGQTGDALPERMLLAAVVETPEGNLYPQLHGPAALVRETRDDFVAFVTGIRAETRPEPAEQPAK